MKLILSILILCFFSSFNYAQEADTIRIDELTFLLPDEKWEINNEINYKWAVEFYMNKTFLFDVSGKTYLTVVKDSMREELQNLHESAIADTIFKNEKLLWEKRNNQSNTNYEIYKLKITEKYISGKYFHILSFKTKTINVFPGEMGREILYWYFPDDFMLRHVSYGFRLIEIWFGQNTGSSDSEYIDFVIKNITIKNN